jgi:hypothetical protein
MHTHAQKHRSRCFVGVKWFFPSLTNMIMAVHACTTTHTHTYIYILTYNLRNMDQDFSRRLPTIHACTKTYIYIYIHTYMHTYIYPQKHGPRCFFLVKWVLATTTTWSWPPCRYFFVLWLCMCVFVCICICVCICIHDMILAALQEFLCFACAYVCLFICICIRICIRICPLGRVWSKLVNLGTGQSPAFHSLRQIHNHGSEITLKGRSESFFFESWLNPTQHGLEDANDIMIWFFSRLRICMCVCICMCVFARTCVWTYNMVYEYMYIYAYIHTYIS